MVQVYPHGVHNAKLRRTFDLSANLLGRWAKHAPTFKSLALVNPTKQGPRQDIINEDRGGYEDGRETYGLDVIICLRLSCSKDINCYWTWYGTEDSQS